MLVITRPGNTTTWRWDLREAGRDPAGGGGAEGPTTRRSKSAIWRFGDQRSLGRHQKDGSHGSIYRGFIGDLHSVKFENAELR